MVSKLIVIFCLVELLFLTSGAVVLGYVLIASASKSASPTIGNVAHRMLIDRLPLNVGILNAVVIFIAFVTSLPALMMQTNRLWLRLHGWLITGVGLFTLCVGVSIWVTTLQTRSNLAAMWEDESPLAQSLLQQRFDCCGYFAPLDPPFVQDSVCTNTLVATQKGGCIAPFSNFANAYLDILFTFLFGIVGIDVILLLCVAMVLKQRHEYERYKHIDEKNGMGRI